MKGVQCYELFGGIALKIHTFFSLYYFIFLIVTSLSHNSLIVMAAVSVALAIITGTILRIVLFYTGIPEWLCDRKGIVTPLSSWDRFLEGVALEEQHISPYEGDIFHETPILLRCLPVFRNILGGYMPLFLLIDVIIGILLSRIAHEFLNVTCTGQQSGPEKDVCSTVDHVTYVKAIITWIHFLSPYSIATCLVHSTSVFSTLSVLTCLFYVIRGDRFFSCVWLSVSAYQALYPVIFIIPVSMQLFFMDNPRPVSYLSKNACFSYIRTVLTFCFCLFALIYVSFVLEGSWQFVYSTYGFILTAPDHTPNIGIFWYFFTEMFDHFQEFFVFVFQMNIVIYSIPLAIRLKEHAIFQLYIVMFVVSIFKSYPSYADVQLCLSLLPLWCHAIKYMRNVFIESLLFLVVSVLSPIFWHLWIYTASANANFYFAITLTFCTAQVFLLTDILFAYLRYEYDLEHGTSGDKKTLIVLQ